MCSYCGCQTHRVIRLLTIQHEHIINTLGQMCRMASKNMVSEAREFAYELIGLLKIHNNLEEAGLFDALMSDTEYHEALRKLKGEHLRIDELLIQILEGDISLVIELERTLRDNISNEENGLFPVTAITMNDEIWDKIELDQSEIMQTLTEF